MKDGGVAKKCVAVICKCGKVKNFLNITHASVKHRQVSPRLGQISNQVLNKLSVTTYLCSELSVVI